MNSPIQTIKGEIPNVTDNDFHARDLPILARPIRGLNVNQLFTLMIGTVPAERICHRKPTSVTYSAVFVVDLLGIRNIDDLRADDNGAWIHGGKPRRCYHVKHKASMSAFSPSVPMALTASSFLHWPIIEEAKK